MWILQIFKRSLFTTQFAKVCSMCDAWISLLQKSEIRSKTGFDMIHCGNYVICQVPIKPIADYFATKKIKPPTNWYSTLHQFLGHGSTTSATNESVWYTIILWPVVREHQSWYHTWFLEILYPQVWAAWKFCPSSLTENHLVAINMNSQIHTNSK